MSQFDDSSPGLGREEPHQLSGLLLPTDGLLAN